MHYFSFNIKKYRNKTGHLSNDEDLAYRRLIEEYYDTEAPIPVGTQSVARRLRMGDKAQIVEAILQEFFVLGEDNFWHHEECDQVIAAYHAMTKRNKNNGLKGGRKSNKKVKSQSEPSRFPVGTQMAGQPITNNHNIESRESTNVDSPPIPPKGDFILPEWIPKSVWDAFSEMRRRIRKPMTQRAKELVVLNLTKLRLAGNDPVAVLERSIENSWQGVFELPENAGTKRLGQQTMQRKRTYSDDLQDAASMAIEQLERTTSNEIY